VYNLRPGFWAAGDFTRYVLAPAVSFSIVVVELDVRFGYGADAPWVTPERDSVQFVAVADAVVVRAPFELVKGATALRRS